MTISQIAQRSTAIRRTALAAVLVAAILLGETPRLIASSLTERDVKAAFIYNFAKFVGFPADTFTNPESPIVVGVLDDAQIADVLEKLVKGKTANGRRLEIKRFSKIQQCDSCQVLFVGSSQGDRISEVLDKVKNKGILTIGDSEGFARRGGIIGFAVESNKIGFEINVAAARREGLKISSKLLSLARVVIG